jgi:hypothetical protein
MGGSLSRIVWAVYIQINQSKKASGMTQAVSACLASMRLAVRTTPVPAEKKNATS